MGSDTVMARANPHSVWAGADDQREGLRTVTLMLRSGHTVTTQVRPEYVEQWTGVLLEAMKGPQGAGPSRGHIQLPAGIVAIGDVVGLTVDAE